MSYHVHTDRCYILMTANQRTRQARLLDLLHELVHCAIDSREGDASPHGPKFRALAHKVGLTGPARFTPGASRELKAFLRHLDLPRWPAV